MKRLNMFRKLIFGFLILIVVLTSGCINSYEQSQKTQPIITPISTHIQDSYYPTLVPTKNIINLDAMQIILDKNDVEEVLGGKWTEKISNGSNPQYTIPKSVIMKSFDGEYHIFMELRVYEDENAANYEYTQWLSWPKYRDNIFDLNISDHAKIQTIDYKDNFPIITTILHVKNNIFINMNIQSSRNNMISIDKSYKLARKQEEKISRILEMVK